MKWLKIALKLCLCCSVVPVSLIVLLVALILPSVLPHPRLVEAPAPTCNAGVFVSLVKQPDLGLQHYPLSRAPLVFAQLENNGCNITYALNCPEQSVELVESVTCSDTSKASRPKTMATMKGEWEMCRPAQGKLRLLVPVIDLSFDIPVASGYEVVGCIRISAQEYYLPEFAKVVGSVEKQQAALIERKQAVGGCPTFRSREDRISRGWDFASEYGQMVGLTSSLLQRYFAYVARSYANGTPPTTASPIHLALGLATAAAGGSEELLFSLASRLNCGEEMPTLLPVTSIQVSRHSYVANLISNPKQQRTKVIGGGASEVCFDPTLPVFLSSGSPEHTQVRQLWDAVGLKTMHEGDLPPIQDQPKSLNERLFGMPLLPDIGSIVTPIFFEKLWQKKPSKEEAEILAGYATFGGMCILSQILEKLPFLPAKVLRIRKTALDFARLSPVGQAIVEEMQSSKYDDLRQLYASRPKGTTDTAIQNLADASMFAGLVGTSSMTFMCVRRLWHSPDNVRLFRENSTAFLYELMRISPVVAGSISVLSEPMKLQLWGEEVTLPVGSKLSALTGFASGFDSGVFPEPFKLDPSRPNIGEMMTWNGKLKHVLAQNYSGAPRYCPGALLSVKIAAHVCNHLTKHLKTSPTPANLPPSTSTTTLPHEIHERPVILEQVAATVEKPLEVSGVVANEAAPLSEEPSIWELPTVEQTSHSEPAAVPPKAGAASEKPKSKSPKSKSRKK